MDTKGRRISEMATSITGYKAVCEDDFPANSIGGQRFSAMSDLDSKLNLHGSRWAQEKNAASAATQRKRTLLESVRRQMTAIRLTAVSCEPQMPGISQNFQMPTSLSGESLIEAARAFIASATPLKPLFLGREMPENFLEVLADTIQSYEEAVNDYNLHRANATAAKTMFKDTCNLALALKRELDPIVRNKYRNDPEKLALWEAASHLERQARRSTPDEPDDGNEPPPDVQT